MRNMREIKFRAWQKHYKEMYQPHNGWIEFHRGKLSVVGFNDGDLQLRPDDVILMQYTGLKDKNGKEIYEGDIVTHPYNREETITMTLDPHQIHKLVEFGEWDMLSHSEVIGNIYENPELLK